MRIAVADPEAGTGSRPPDSSSTEHAFPQIDVSVPDVVAENQRWTDARRSRRRSCKSAHHPRSAGSGPDEKADRRSRRAGSPGPSSARALRAGGHAARDDRCRAVGRSTRLHLTVVSPRRLRSHAYRPAHSDRPARDTSASEADDSPLPLATDIRAADVARGRGARSARAGRQLPVTAACDRDTRQCPAPRSDRRTRPGRGVPPSPFTIPRAPGTRRSAE